MAAARRILVYGVTGSGKTRLAREASARTGLPLYEVDEAMWRPGWQTLEPEMQAQWAQDVAKKEAWILDTAYGTWLECVIDRAELVVALDYPRAVSFCRLLRRTASRVVTGEPCCNGNRESLAKALSADSILLWHFRSFRRKRERIEAWCRAGLPVVRLRSPWEAAAWLSQLRRVA